MREGGRSWRKMMFEECRCLKKKVMLKGDDARKEEPSRLVARDY